MKEKLLNKLVTEEIKQTSNKTGEKFKEKDYYFPHNNIVKRGKPFRTPEKPGYEIDINILVIL